MKRSLFFIAVSSKQFDKKGLNKLSYNNLQVRYLLFVYKTSVYMNAKEFQLCVYYLLWKAPKNVIRPAKSCAEKAAFMSSTRKIPGSKRARADFFSSFIVAAVWAIPQMAAFFLHPWSLRSQNLRDLKGSLISGGVDRISRIGGMWERLRLVLGIDSGSVDKVDMLRP